MNLWAGILYEEGRFKEAASEALCALEVYEKIGAVNDLEKCRDLLQDIKQATESQSTSSGSDSDAYCTPSDDSDHSPSS